MPLYSNKPMVLYDSTPLSVPLYLCLSLSLCLCLCLCQWLCLCPSVCLSVCLSVLYNDNNNLFFFLSNVTVYKCIDTTYYNFLFVFFAEKNGSLRTTYPSTMVVNALNSFNIMLLLTPLLSFILHQKIHTDKVVHIGYTRMYHTVYVIEFLTKIIHQFSKIFF